MDSGHSTLAGIGLEDEQPLASAAFPDSFGENDAWFDTGKNGISAVDLPLAMDLGPPQCRSVPGLSQVSMVAGGIFRPRRQGQNFLVAESILGRLT